MITMDMSMGGGGGICPPGPQDYESSGDKKKRECKSLFKFSPQTFFLHNDRT